MLSRLLARVTLCTLNKVHRDLININSHVNVDACSVIYTCTTPPEVMVVFG